MKWLRENWTKVILILLVLFIGYGLRNNVQHNREYRESVKGYETDISLRQDSINDLKEALRLEHKTAIIHKGRIEELEEEAEDQEIVIKNKDKELKEEKQKIKDLTPDENVELLATNLSKEMGEEVKLKLKIVKNDTVVQLDIKHVAPLNIVFAERNLNIEKMNKMQGLIDIKNDGINTQALLIISHEKSMGLLEETITQKDGVIADKDGIIKEMKKKSRRDKLKYFLGGFIAGGLTVAGLTLL